MRVCVFAPDKFKKELEAANVDIIGDEDILKKAAAGEVNFDKIIATQD